MNDKNKIPLLDHNDDSLEIINLFREEFLNYLRTQPKAVNPLLKLHKNGNQKAEEIIKYLIKTIPKEVNEGLSKRLRQIWHSGNVSYKLTWSKLKLDDLIQNQESIVEFNFEIMLDKELDTSTIATYILSAKDKSAFKEEFLLKEITDFVKEKGFKFRRQNPEKDRGALAPYVNIDFDTIDEKPNLNKPRSGPFAKYIKGKCYIRLISLNY